MGAVSYREITFLDFPVKGDQALLIFAVLASRVMAVSGKIEEMRYLFFVLLVTARRCGGYCTAIFFPPEQRRYGLL